MDKRWIEYDKRFSYSDNYNYPLEGLEVMVTNGISVDVMWFVYSGGGEWCWSDPSDIDGFAFNGIPFEPTHWMLVESYKPILREKKLINLLENGI